MPKPSRSASMRPHPHPGFFVTLEGPDGGGKTTQAAKLSALLRSQGLDVVACHDPGSTPLGDRLRELLLGRDQTHSSMRAEMLLYMASRAQLVDEVIRPSLAAGRVVVSDRFVLSTCIYQGVAGGLPPGELWQVAQAATGGLMPDLTVILDVPPSLARERVGGPRDRIEDRPSEYQSRVRQGYLDVAQAAGEDGGCPFYPAAVVLVDASAGPDVVFTRIRSEVERVLAIGTRP